MRSDMRSETTVRYHFVGFRDDRYGLPDEPLGQPIGREMSNLSDNELIDCREMIVHGLVEIVDGWRGTMWFTLTDAGRRLRDEGEAG
jgi:hypothetical protein